MLYDAIDSVLAFLRALSQCLQSLDQDAVVRCGGPRTVRLTACLEDTCKREVSEEQTFPATMTVAQLRERLATLEKYLEQILRLVCRRH